MYHAGMQITPNLVTLPIAKILSVKNAPNFGGNGLDWQLLNGSQDFDIFFFIYFFKYKTIKTHARAFLTLNILAIGRVMYLKTKTPIALPLCTGFCHYCLNLTKP